MFRRWFRKLLEPKPRTAYRDDDSYVNQHISDVNALWPEADLVEGRPQKMYVWYTDGDHEYYAEPITPKGMVWRRPREEKETTGKHRRPHQ